MVPGGHMSVDNSLFAGTGSCLTIVYSLRDLADARVAATRNTFVTSYIFSIIMTGDATGAPAKVPVVQVDSSSNILDGHVMLALTYGLPDQDALDAFDDSAVHRGWLSWRDQNNLYRDQRHFFRSAAFVVASSPRSVILCKSQTEWDDFWGLQSTSSVPGQIRFQGGDLRAKGVATPEKLTPEQFRLAPQSPGTGAGPGGKDLGADVDLVGPGPRYERWKQTPDYQQWLKDTGQEPTVGAAAPRQP
jgi:hypothetical protein